MMQPGIGDKDLDGLINNRLVEDEDEDLDSLIEQRLNELGLITTGAIAVVGITVLIKALKSIYRHFLAKDKECTKYELERNPIESTVYRRCKIYYKINALNKTFLEATKKQKECKNTRNPEKCMKKLDELKNDYMQRVYLLKAVDDTLYNDLQFYIKQMKDEAKQRQKDEVLKDV